jgi:hypothetical protein
MVRSSRLFVIVLAGLSVSFAGCSSNNKGKIVGKWKFVSSSDNNKESQKNIDQMKEMGAYLYFEFKADNTLVVGLDADKPEMIQFIKAMVPNNKVTWTGKYKLQSGNKVEIHDMEPDAKQFIKGDKARSEIIIDGDNMTIKDPDGSSAQLVRIKDAAPTSEKK